jgi:hypothetical protein
MTWEGFAETMQSIDLPDSLCGSQAAYISASRAGAEIARPQGKFKPHPMPKARKKLGLRRSFNPIEFALIRKGFIPASSDDKWFIAFDATQCELRLYRSWTGFCIYIIRFREGEDGCEISESCVNREPEQYNEASIEHDANMATWLIDVFLLGREKDFPTHSQPEEVR